MTDKEMKAYHEDKPCATVTIKGADTMHPDTREFIAKWLRTVGRRLVKEGDNYAPTFRAKYFRMKWK